MQCVRVWPSYRSGCDLLQLRGRSVRGPDKTGGATHVEHAEVIDRDHAALQSPCHLNALLLVGAEYTRPKTVACAIGDTDGFFDRLVLDDERYGCEHYNPTNQRRELYHKLSTHIRAVRTQNEVVRLRSPWA